jgi:hypothetical protein
MLVGSRFSYELFKHLNLSRFFGSAVADLKNGAHQKQRLGTLNAFAARNRFVMQNPITNLS